MSSVRRPLGALVVSFALVAVAIATGAAEATAQSPMDDRHPGCDSEEAHRFDFWAGEWEVESRYRLPDGSWHESTQEWVAEEVVGGCVFIDFADGDFAGARMRGMGTRYFDPTTEEWVITWISTAAPGQWGEWRGTFHADDAGDFFQTLETPQGTLTTRIRWEDLTETSAHWEYGVSNDGGENWTTAWVMEFRKRG